MQQWCVRLLRNFSSFVLVARALCTNVVFVSAREDSLGSSPTSTCWREHPSTAAPMVVEGFGSLKRTTLGKELRENRIYRALYSYTDADGVVQLLLTSHVDDLLCAIRHVIGS